MKTRHYTNPSPYQYNLVTEKIVQKANMIIDQENSKLSIMSENKQKYQMFRLLQHKYDPTLYHQICGQPTNINNVTRKKSQEYIVIFTRENIISGKSFSTGFLEYLQRNQLLDSSYYNAITTSEDILKIVNKYIEEHLNKNRITNHLSIEDKPLEIKAF
ncbi:hypothetical protein DLEV_102 [Diachasmimorpha longicaudata entomopoxvirus]|uniref:Uncharacterized protein n=1 Tax=Diachasmimorpha longicaudata entomopoxvirus TaxID=109981 RepID=A0A7R5WJA9_9POXV|nr:hypothetical protein QKK69_gp102 [Diachasmimorpha longicaudata entomopoxvirus]AKS26393.1 hypothetical protein DLEV_102 [Diachasmimorpha longicaudata entomopoxvirus]